MPVKTNYQQWSVSTRQVQRAYGESFYRSTQQASIAVRDSVRRRIPPGAVSGRFTGRSATGSLKQSITAGTPVKSGNRYIARVGVDPGASRLNQIKASVHEYGTVIRGKPWLIFQIAGEWKKVRQVRIREKRFFRDGIEDVTRRFSQIVTDAITDALPRG